MDAGDAGGDGEASVHYGQARGRLLVRATLPLPPTTNNLYASKVVTSKERDGDGNRKLYSVRYLTKDGDEYHTMIKYKLMELRAMHRSAKRVAYRLLVCPFDQRRFDISNRIKVLEDAFKVGGLYVDDEQIDEVWIRRGPIVKGGIVRISVWEVVPDYNANLRWVEG